MRENKDIESSTEVSTILSGPLMGTDFLILGYATIFIIPFDNKCNNKTI